jgi:hypothetical protein
MLQTRDYKMPGLPITQPRPMLVPYQTLFDKDYNLTIPALDAAAQAAQLALQRETNVGNVPKISFSVAGQFSIDPTMAGQFNITLTGDAALLVTNAVSTTPMSMELRIIQDTLGGHIMYWPLNVRWALNKAPVLNTTQYSVCLVSLNYDPDTNVWDGSVKSGEIVTASGNGSGGSAGFTFVQNTAESLWVINHMLGKIPTIVIIDSSGNEVEGEVKYVNTNQVTITFSSPFSGEASLT